MPMLGYGTIGGRKGADHRKRRLALHNGYGLIDTANRYGNEVEVGRGLKKIRPCQGRILLRLSWGPPFTVRTALWRTPFKTPGHRLCGSDVAAPPGKRLSPRLQNAGKGVSGREAAGHRRFQLLPVEKLREVLEQCEIRPMVMQVECHPYYPCGAGQGVLRGTGIRLQCWYPFGPRQHGPLHDPVLAGLAQMDGRSAAQIVLRWHFKWASAPVPGSKVEGAYPENGPDL